MNLILCEGLKQSNSGILVNIEAGQFAEESVELSHSGIHQHGAKIFISGNNRKKKMTRNSKIFAISDHVAHHFISV